MRWLYLVVVILLMSCGRTKNESAQSSAMDSLTVETAINNSLFSGEYLVGDGGYLIKATEDGYEMRSSPQSEPMFLSFDKVEQDSVFVYSTKDRSIIFKMNPDHNFGMYYENDETWPVSRLSTVKEETKEEETARILKQRQEEDEMAYRELGVYDGDYTLVTEDAHVYTNLKLHYKGDRVFTFELSLQVTDVCDGVVKGELSMDRTQHGFYDNKDCPLHFNFGGSSADYGMILELDQAETCSLLSESCSFTGTYSTTKPE